MAHPRLLRTAMVAGAVLCLSMSASVTAIGMGEAPSKATELLTDPDPKWHACQTVMDCTIIHGFCGQPEAVNHRYALDYKRWIEDGPPTACALMPAPKSVTVTCEKSRCFARRKGKGPMPMPPGTPAPDQQ